MAQFLQLPVTPWNGVKHRQARLYLINCTPRFSSPPSFTTTTIHPLASEHRLLADVVDDKIPTARRTGLGYIVRCCYCTVQVSHSPSPRGLPRVLGLAHPSIIINYIATETVLISVYLSFLLALLLGSLFACDTSLHQHCVGDSDAVKGEPTSIPGYLLSFAL